MKTITEQQMSLKKPANLLSISSEPNPSTTCDNCGSREIIDFSAHCIDEFYCCYKDKKYDGYVPSKIGIGGGDDVEIKYCATCGKIQGNFPINKRTIIKELSAVSCDEYDEE